MDRFYYKDSKGNYYNLKNEREGLIAITEEEFNTHNKQKEFVKTEKMEAKKQIQKLKIELSKLDYKTIKYIEGALTKKEFEEVKAIKTSLRNKINELEENL